MFNWQEGRQGTGYFKMLLLQSKRFLLFDVWLLKYPLGAFIPTHTDPIPNKRHFRLNIVLSKLPQTSNRKGFEATHVLFETQRMVLFRPDITPHSVLEVMERPRYVLSIGWALDNR